MISTQSKLEEKASLNPALKDFWQTKADTKVLKGGRVSSKTWDCAGFAIFLASNYTVKFLCMRQFQNKIKESVYAVLKVQIERFGLQDEFEVLATEIRHRITGSSFHFYGIHRDIAEIKGFEGADIGWMEEGEGLTKEQWSHIEPTLRKEGAECWILYNPRLVSDFVEKFTHDPKNDIIVRQINYDENPFLSETALRKINRMKEQDYEEYEHVYLGIPRKDDDNVVIKRSHIDAAIDAHIKLNIDISGKKRSGFDVADGGKDLCSHIYVHGITAIWGEHWKAKEDELLESCKRVYSKALGLESHVSYDSIGVGAGSGAKFKELNDERRENGEPGKITYSKFIAGAKVVNPDKYYVDTDEEKITNKDFFENLKAQSWWIVAERFRNTYNAVTKGHKFEEHELISISSDMPNLANLTTELSTPRRKFSKAGKVMVESKEDLAKRDIPSPNDADAFIMCYAPQEQQESFGLIF
jgi:phage terminase large subunit